GRRLRSDPEARVGDEHVAPGILDAQEDLEAVRGIVLRAQQGERLEAGRDSTETDFATPDAMAVEASGSEAFLRQHSKVPSLRSVLDVRCANLPLDALDPAPSRDDRLDSGDEFHGFLGAEGRVTAGFPEPMQGRPRQDERWIELQEVGTVGGVLEEYGERFHVPIRIRA